MAYRIAGIDVDKKMVAVAIADVEIAEMRFERGRLARARIDSRAGGMARRARGRRSGDGIDGAVLASPSGTRWSGSGSRGNVRGPALHRAPGRCICAGAVERRAARPETGFPRCRTVGETVGRAGAQAQLCAGCRARRWRTVTRRKYQVTCNRVQLRIGSSVCSRKRTSRSPVWSRICSGPVGNGCCAPSRMAKRIPARVAALGSARLHATPDQFRCARGVCGCIPFTRTCSR